MLLASNKASSGIFSFGPEWGVPTELMPPGKFRQGAYLLDLLRRYEIELLVLAGYMKLIPAEVVQAYPRRILNVHPALLPAYGGKGMYGMNVHEAVISAREKLSGLTIHYVNEVYDAGEVILQAQVKVEADWQAADLQQAVLRLEHALYPQVVEKVCHELQASRK